MEPARRQELADALWEARRSGVPIAPLTESDPGITLEDAYLVSLLNSERRVGLPGVRRIGKKIGLTSRAVQKQLGVDQPDFGYLTSDMEIPQGGELASSRLLQGKIEGEVAFVLKQPLRGPGVTIADVRAATDYVRVAIEIIDSRVRDWKIRIQDTVADNASSAFLVMGTKHVALADVDLVSANMNLWINGELKSHGKGSACLDDPLNAVAWLANKMGELGVSLDAGDVILSGAYGPVVPVKAGDDCAVEIDGLGRVEFRVVER